MEHYNIEEASKAQAEYCGRTRLPHFAPSSGVCYCCHKNIYDEIDGYGITVERAGTSLITGCPHCHYSFCE